jgi:hypothetical protein
LQTTFFLLQSGNAALGLVAKLPFRNLHTFGCCLVDARSQLGGLATLDTVPRQGLLHSHAEHFAGRAELASDHLSLADEGVEHAILLALVVEEVAAGHDLRRLKLSVDAAVALFEARRVPRQIDVDEIVAAGLGVQSLARRVAADEDANGLPIEGRIEGDLDPVALFEARLSREDEDAPVQVHATAAALEQAFLQSLDEPASGVVPLREQNEPSIAPNMGGVEHLGLDPVQHRADARVRRIARGVEIAEFRFCLSSRDLDEVVVLQEFCVSVGLVRVALLTFPEQCLSVGGQRPVKSLDRGGETLLKVREKKARPGVASRGLPVIVEHGGQAQFRGVERQSADVDGLDDALRKRVPKAAQVLLEPPDHDRFKLFRFDVDTAGEALRIQNFEKGRE